MFYPKTVKMKLYLKFIFNEFEASILSNRQMIYKLFPEMNYILRDLMWKIMKIFLKNFHLCSNKLNNLDKSEISSKLKHEDNAKDLKLELGQTEIYILPLYLIAHE